MECAYTNVYESQIPCRFWLVVFCIIFQILLSIMAKLLATSKLGAVVKRPRRRIGEISREVQQELNRMTKAERAALQIRVACKLLT